MPNLKPLVNNRDLYEDFKEYIESKIQITQRSLEQAHTLVDIHRLQGSIHAYRRLLKMREDVNGPEPIKTSR
ncbi:hypothetical protein [uncultured virus]|uniref:Uncharacterized protein n=1 Tax=uncultured virus TaxID=340016 RepID=A0A218MMS1_9VIRU|nr:hypothetical protein [uncultured virus]